MDIKKLFSAPAVIIDEKVKQPNGDLIGRIKEKLNQNNIPVIELEQIPNNNLIKSLKDVSFILLDWELFDDALSGTAQAEEIIKENFKFIRKIKKEVFVPIFIFSNSNPDNIKQQLIEKKLYNSDKPNFIFIKRKQDLFDSSYSRFYFFSLISNWIKSLPSIYVLKEWENALNKAKNKLFWDFYNINHKWPSVLQKTFKDDGSDVNYELGNFIFKNITARTEPIKFDEDILSISDDELSKIELRKVLETERFIKNDSLPSIPFTGDLFKLYKYELSEKAISDKKFYFLNIRPDCDIIRGSNPTLYCLECEEVDDNEVQTAFNEGSLISKVSTSYIPFLDDGKVLIVHFKNLRIFKWKEKLYTINGEEGRIFSNTRIGRILPPYITAIQQKYSFYLQRQGLPAIPEKAIKND